MSNPTVLVEPGDIGLGDDDHVDSVLLDVENTLVCLSEIDSLEDHLQATLYSLSRRLAFVRELHGGYGRNKETPDAP